jgi:hypothetical protein
MAILAHHGAGIFTKLGDFGQGQMLGFIFQHHGEPIWAKKATLGNEIFF